MLAFSLLLLELTGALPFVTTWKTTQANEAILLAPIRAQTAVTISWGDATTSNMTAGQSSTLNHTYASPGLHNVSVDGLFFWDRETFGTTKEKLVDISNWGDGFLVQHNPALFAHYPNLQVSASPDSQPLFLPGTSLEGMFFNSSFNSPLNWDLTNVTSLYGMFARTPLNQPINFRNTQRIQSTAGMFEDTPYFNQPFHFDASGLTTANSMFNNASSFNQVVNLTNSSLLADTSFMFSDATSFNQPITFNTSSVTSMTGMFSDAIKFNQSITFNTSQVTSMEAMFFGADSFNQPINLRTPKLTTTKEMFSLAQSFNQPVVLDTSNVITMNNMFSGAVNFASTVTFTSTAKVTDMTRMFSTTNVFTQDLSSWNTQNVTQCSKFCDFCGLPAFPSCTPCPGMRYTVGQLSVCSTRPPTIFSPLSPSPSGGTGPSMSAAATTAPVSMLSWAVVLLPLMMGFKL